jgi:hypothetical protein
MLRIGMTNPPFILEHLNEIAAVLRHPCVYSFLHVPVQSGSDAVLTVCLSFCVCLNRILAITDSKRNSLIYNLKCLSLALTQHMLTHLRP